MIFQTKTSALEELGISPSGETPVEGQTSVSFSLLEDGEITADMAGSISASYAGTDETADSNLWALILIDNGKIARTYTGDQRAKLIGIKLDPTQRIALVQGTSSDVGASTSNVWSDNTFKASSLEGQSSDVVEANGKSFNIYLAHAAHAGAQSERRVSLNTADSSYRIRSCLRPFLLGCRVILYKKSSAHPVQGAQTHRAFGCSGRGAGSEVTR